jgi:acetyl esterase/lipase
VFDGPGGALNKTRGAADMAAMKASLARLAILVLVAGFGLLGLRASQADAATPFRLPSLFSKPAPAAPVIAPVAAPISIDPAGPARGTVIMVHAGGWAGHDANAQRLLTESPANLFLQRGWRVTSIDYEDGTAGLQDVLDAAGSELARRSTDGPLCIYGESSGAHLALMAASKLRAIDCVIGLGTPTDLSLYQAESTVAADQRVKLVASQINRFFGTTLAQTAPWNLVALAPTIHADVLLIHEADDTVVSPLHDARFAAARPTTQTLTIEPGDPNNPADDFMHGTASAAGRLAYDNTIGAFADRAVASREAERNAARTGCSSVSRSLNEIGLPGLQSGLRCLARKDAEARRAGTASWQQTNIKMRGEINAARIWASLRGSTSGRRALAAAAKKRARMLVQAGDRTRITLRAIRAARSKR